MTTVHATLNYRLSMDDGTELSTNIFLPEGAGPFPVLLVRTPYDASGKGKDGLEWASRGFALVNQDVRGRFLSSGKQDLRREAEDGAASLRWIGEQSWCNGRIAMYGGSYLSMTQLAAACAGDPHLTCITPCLIGETLYRRSYWGNALRLENNEHELPLSDHLQVRALRSQDVLAHPHYDEYWKLGSIKENYDQVQAPAFIRTGWFDIFFCDAFDLFNGIRSQAASPVAREHTRILVGPWPHDINKVIEGSNYGPDAPVKDLYEQEVAYIQHFTGRPSEYDQNVAPIRIFVMGENVWRDENEWPLARTVFTPYFLGQGGRLNAATGEGADTYSYDPANPVPTLGGAWGMKNVGSFDQRVIENRDDVLVYSAPPLAEPMEITGPVSATLFVASSAPDTDFTVKLVDLHPDGKAMNITDGIVRARYRNPGKEEFLEEHKVYELTIECCPTSYVLVAGHAVRLEVSSSNYPAFSRNLNTADPIATGTDMRIAKQTIHHSSQYPSHIVLPVIPN